MPERRPDKVNEWATHERPSEDEAFHHAVGRKANRKLRARSQKDRSPWFWLGMFGLVGWSVALPLVLGVVAGAWLDQRFNGRISWTLTLLFVGAALGCWTAWHWVKRESSRS
jgi:ATP synthase protein I